VVQGTFSVPSHLTGDGSPGSRLARGPDGTPAITGTYEASFTCVLTPQQLGTGGPAQPARPVVFGHGLLGDRSAVTQGDLGFARWNVMPCATDMTGMSSADVPYAVAALADLNLFPSVPDRLRQGMVNHLFLARLLRSPDGFVSHPAFRDLTGEPAVDTGRSSTWATARVGSWGRP
jgi:hypothetical protein